MKSAWKSLFRFDDATANPVPFRRCPLNDICGAKVCVLAPIAAAIVLPVVAELPLCRLLRPPLMRLRMLPCRCTDPAAGESDRSVCRGGDIAPADVVVGADVVVSERGRSPLTAVDGSPAYAADTACAAAMSDALAETSSDFNGKCVAEDIGLGSALSEIPRWAKLKFPDPSVSTASLRFSLPMLSVDSAISGPMTSSPPVSFIFLSSDLCWFVVLVLF